MTIPVTALFDSLEGRWSVERQIESGGLHGVFKGIATFSRVEPAVFSYTEKGQMDFNGYRGEASRQYRYELRDDKIYIHYDDGMNKGDILHELQFSQDESSVFSARHCHQCGQDFYTVTMTIQPHQKITTTYVVKGANKDYRLLSVYERC